MTFITPVWSRSSINDNRTIVDEQTKVYPPNVERRGENWIILLSIINEYALRRPLDNLSWLHATKHKLMCQGQQRKLPLVCNQELELFPSRKTLSRQQMSLQAEFNSEAIQALEAHRQHFVDEFTSVLRRREIPNHEYNQHLQSKLHQQTW